ncbi:MAG: hypothetical protein GY913_27805 [Proteobacteria bacterium]|nr:hypothetical protein [Pseudomonadota bacterium]MCP4920718.1 hypothetical protein [Pseudomonadota bacterium]
MIRIDELNPVSGDVVLTLADAVDSDAQDTCHATQVHSGTWVGDAYVSWAGRASRPGCPRASVSGSAGHESVMGLDELCDLYAEFGLVCDTCADGVEACVVAAMAGSSTQPGVALLDLAEDQTENNLCEGSCDNEVDDDGDGEVDVDPECDSRWPDD